MNRRRIKAVLLRAWPDGEYVVGDDDVDDQFDINETVSIQIGMQIANVVVELDDDSFWIGPPQRTIKGAIEDARARLTLH